MNQIEINKKNVLIEEYGEEYKSLLNKYIYEYRQNPKDIVDISDLTSIDRQAKSVLRINDKTRKRNRFIDFIGILGILYATIGCVVILVTYLIGYNGEQLSDYAQSIVTIIFSVLCIIGTMCNSISILLKIKESKKYTSTSRFDKFDDTSTTSSNDFQIIMIWKEIEMLLFKLSPEDTQTDLKLILQFLSETNAIDKRDIINIYQIRECRNNILHGKTFLKYDEKQSILNAGNNIILKLYSQLYK